MFHLRVYIYVASMGRHLPYNQQLHYPPLEGLSEGWNARKHGFSAAMALLTLPVEFNIESGIPPFTFCIIYKRTIRIKQLCLQTLDIHISLPHQLSVQWSGSVLCRVALSQNWSSMGRRSEESIATSVTFTGPALILAGELLCLN